MKLVIVESPSKAKTLNKYLGADFKVDASGGHVRDLPEKNLGVDVKNNFEPKYVVSANKKDVIKRLKEEAKKADFVYLATDPDREGEAISWHLGHCLDIPQDRECRIEFNEISEKAVREAIGKPRKIDINLVDAQQARRVLDRLVGYKLSPLLCKRIQDRLSAGRVQSVALRLIVEREREIQAFKPEEYWTVTAILSKEGIDEVLFKAVLVTGKGKKIKPKSREEVDEILKGLEGNPWKVASVKKGVSKSHAPMPFTTSTLQQDAVQKLNITAPQTMMFAQNLYEGVEIKGEGQVALVTYIRTDSVRISADAQAACLQFIEQKFGKEYCPATPNVYKVKKSAQDAHEAIRPISLSRTPESLKGKIQPNQYRLYKLIYERFVASQMAEAQYNTMTIDVACGEYGFRASGKSMLFKGYTAVYEDAKKEDVNAESEETDGLLPNMEEGDTLVKHDIKTEQKFTKPPARFTEASLVKTMEEKGIGRPSTYATIISVIFKRAYTVKDGKYMRPTDLGMEVNDMVVKYFNDIINTSFTADLEARLDTIEDGGKNWQSIVGEFYEPFIKELNAATAEGEEMSDVICEKCGARMLIKTGRNGSKYLACSAYPDCKNIKSLDEEKSDEVCEKCGAPMVIKKGRFGKYLACSAYPDCKNTRSLDQETTDEKCEKCGSPMVVKNGKFGKYMACSAYPACKFTKPMPSDVLMKCPNCGKDVVKRVSKTGKIFYGCTGYPACDFASWDMPAGKDCPDCGKYMVVKITKKGKSLKCSSCAYTEALPEESEGAEGAPQAAAPDDAAGTAPQSGN